MTFSNKRKRGKVIRIEQTTELLFIQPFQEDE